MDFPGKCIHSEGDPEAVGQPVSHGIYRHFGVSLPALQLWSAMVMPLQPAVKPMRDTGADTVEGITGWALGRPWRNPTNVAHTMDPVARTVYWVAHAVYHVAHTVYLVAHTMDPVAHGLYHVCAFPLVKQQLPLSKHPSRRGVYLSI